MNGAIFDRLEGTLEKAVHDADCWVEAIDEAANIMGGKSGLLIPMEPSFRGCWMKYSKSLTPAIEQYIAEGWHLNDFRQRFVPLCKEHGYASEDDILASRDEQNSMPYYVDFLFKHNVGFSICIKIETINGNWILALYFDNHHPPITDEQIELTKELSKRFEAATLKADKFAHQKIYDFALFFNNSQTEIHLFDPQGNHCLKLNNQGSFSDEVPIRPSYISNELSNELYAELRELCISDPSQSLSKSHQVRFLNQSFNLLAIQIPNTLRHFHMIFKVCVIATKSADETHMKTDYFAQQYKLTDAEITTLELLVNGNSVNSIADLLSLKSSTIRQRLKAIYEKSSVNSQVELIALYHQN